MPSSHEVYSRAWGMLKFGLRALVILGCVDKSEQ